VGELQQSAEDKQGEITDLQERVDALDKENAEYRRSVNQEYVRFREAIEERGKFEHERNNATAELVKLQTESKEEIDALKAKVAQLEAEARGRAEAANSGVAGDQKAGPATMLESELEAARAEITRQKKKAESAEGSLEYTRKAYQDASRAASDLGLQNQELQAKVGDLSTVAEDSFRRVHEINGQTRIRDLERRVDEQDMMLREREAALDRANKELAALRNGRRETRQASVPRSPRMGSMMSPRTVAGVGGRAGGVGGFGGSGSRGTSPAPASDTTTLQAGLPFNGSSRFLHLRQDKY
jgi:chromosome segregation ATPase